MTPELLSALKTYIDAKIDQAIARLQMQECNQEDREASKTEHALDNVAAKTAQTKNSVS